MKRRLSIFCAGLAGLFLAGSAAAAEIESEVTHTQYSATVESNDWDLIQETLIEIPAGHSFSRDYYFDPILEADEILVTLSTRAGAPCRAGTTFIETTASEDQRIYRSVYPNIEGTFHIASGSIHFIRYNNYLGGIFGTTCVRRVYARNGGLVDPPDAEFEFLDVLTYEGGFAQGGIAMDNTAKLVKFWMRVPEYCAGMEILEAGTVTEDVFDAASRVDMDGTFMYEVNGGAGMRVSAIKAVLNGPRDLSCDIPIYGQFAE